MQIKAISVLATAITFVLAFTIPASAGDPITASGRNTTVPISSVPTKLPNGTTALTNHTSGVVIVEKTTENNPSLLAQQDCFSTVVVAEDGKSGKVMGHCTAINPKGDVWTLSFNGDFTGGTWEYIDGTGPYAGVKGGGTYKPMGQLPNGNSINSWEGKWTLQ